jgi:hypothetical protein
METIHFTFKLRYSFFNFLLAFIFQKLLRKFHLEMNHLTFRFIKTLDSRHLRSTKRMDFSSDKAVHLGQVLKNQVNRRFKLKLVIIKF